MDRGTAISAASQRASVWLLTRYSRGARVRLCKGGRVEARWMLGDGAARGATPSALAKSTPSPRPFSSSPGMLFPLPRLLSSSLFPLSLFVSFVLLRFPLLDKFLSLSSSLPFFFFFFLRGRLFCLPSVSLSIFRSNVARPFFFSLSLLALCSKFCDCARDSWYARSERRGGALEGN